MPAQALQRPAVLLDMRTCLRLAATLALAALLIVVLERCTGVDLALADMLYDRRVAAFPWRDAWLMATFSHQTLKAGLSLLAALFVVAAITDAIRPQAALRGPCARLKLRVVAWSAVLVPLATSLLKQSSNAHCPWDLARYGGSQPYVRLFEALPAGLALGWMQQMRGAHFLTHTLWSAWIACAVVLALVILLQPSGGTGRRAPAGSRCHAR